MSSWQMTHNRPSVSPFRDFSSSLTTGGWVLLICGWFLLVIGGSVIGARARLWPAPISRDSPPCPCHICEPPPRITKYIWFGIIPLLVKLAGPITFEIFWNGHRQFLYNATIYFFYDLQDPMSAAPWREPVMKIPDLRQVTIWSRALKRQPGPFKGARCLVP